jgi:hypothetical protein
MTTDPLVGDMREADAILSRLAGLGEEWHMFTKGLRHEFLVNRGCSEDEVAAALAAARKLYLAMSLPFDGTGLSAPDLVRAVRQHQQVLKMTACLEVTRLAVNVQRATKGAR